MKHVVSNQSITQGLMCIIVRKWRFLYCFVLQKGEYEVPEWLSPGNLFYSEMSVRCCVMFLLMNNSGVQLKYFSVISNDTSSDSFFFLCEQTGSHSYFLKFICPSQVVPKF